MTIANRPVPAARVVPVLAYPDVVEATERLCDAFGFRVRVQIDDHRTQLVYGDGAVIVTQGGGDPAGHSVHVRVEDADAHDEQAARHGARIVNPPSDYPYGERQYTAEDLGGHRWTFSQSIDDVDPPTGAASSSPRTSREERVVMGKVVLDISVSLDGFVAGPKPTLEHPLGERGERLHEWVYGLASWRERHGRTGGTTGADDEMLAESLATTGAVVMGRRMFSGGRGPWDGDPNADGWWGDDPPFRVPVFVLTHHAREPVTKQGGTTFTFVTDGVDAALERAREAAGDRNVAVGGGASVAQQCLQAGLLDELQIHLAPVLLGAGTRLFESLESAHVDLELTRVIDSPGVTHLRFSVGG